MVEVDDFGRFETAWCPGCGNFGVLRAVKKALANAGIAPRETLFVSGIGQAAKTPHYLRCNFFNGLHGRGLPVATAAKIANPSLHVIYESGDGCTYAEGGNHFLAAVRRNPGITAVVHDNQVYGLTKGQASPTSDPGFATKAQPGPEGVVWRPFNPLATAILHGVSFAARGYAGRLEHLSGVLERAFLVDGFALVDVLQPCPSFNHKNSFGWFNERVRELGPEHDPTDRDAAIALTESGEEEIPLGVFYENREAKPFEKRHPGAAGTALALAGRDTDRQAVREMMESFF